MSNVAAIIDVLDSQIEKLFLKIKNLEQINFDLINKISYTQSASEAQNKAFESLRLKYDALKSASSFLGSEENKKETKLKINTLVREIDYCIAQLST